MASSKTISNEYKERANYNRLQTISLKTENLSVNNLPPNLLNINKPLNGLEYVGINMKPCEYCKQLKDNIIMI